MVLHFGQWSNSITSEPRITPHLPQKLIVRVWVCVFILAKMILLYIPFMPHYFCNFVFSFNIIWNSIKASLTVKGFTNKYAIMYIRTTVAKSSFISHCYFLKCLSLKPYGRFCIKKNQDFYSTKHFILSAFGLFVLISRFCVKKNLFFNHFLGNCCQSFS